MKKILLILSIFLLSIPVLYAHELTGTVTNEGGGTYVVSATGPNGRTYYGEAEDYGDGKLHLVMEDQCEHSYIGSLRPIGDNHFYIRMDNEITDVESTGVVRLVDSNSWFLHP